MLLELEMLAHYFGRLETITTLECLQKTYGQAQVAAALHNGHLKISTLPLTCGRTKKAAGSIICWLA